MPQDDRILGGIAGEQIDVIGFVPKFVLATMNPFTRYDLAQRMWAYLDPVMERRSLMHSRCPGIWWREARHYTGSRHTKRPNHSRSWPSVPAEIGRAAVDQTFVMHPEGCLSFFQTSSSSGEYSCRLSGAKSGTAGCSLAVLRGRVATGVWPGQHVIQAHHAQGTSLKTH